MSRFVSILHSSDINLFYFVNGRLKCKGLDKVIPIITRLGNASTTIAVCLIMAIWGNALMKTAGREALISLSESHLLVQIEKDCMQEKTSVDVERY